jgi:hypothetical protein
MSLTLINLSFVAFAEEKCNGPAELCAQIEQLQSQLDSMERSDAVVAAKKEAEKDQEKEDAGNVAQAIALAAAIATGLKMALSAFKKYKGFFKTSKAKAWRKIITLVVGLAAFVASSIGLGMPWWQAVIVAGGGPGAMFFHDMVKLVQVIMGKKKYRDIQDDLKSDLAESVRPPASEEAPATSVPPGSGS